MKRFKNILAVYNDLVGGDDVLSHAARLARANRADLTIIDILPQGASLAEIAERRKRLDRILTSIRTEGVGNAVPVVVAGTAFIEIIRLVLTNSHDLVIASAEPSAKFMVLCSLLANAAFTAATASGERARIATRNPLSAGGAPRIVVP